MDVAKANIYFRHVGLFLLFIVLLVVLLPTAEATVFKIATISPDGTSWMRTMREGAKEIAKRTQGRVKFKFYPGGVMGNDRSVLRKIRIGQLHGGAITGGSLAHIYTDMQIYHVPFAFNSFEEVDYIRARMDKLILEGLEKHGFVSFGIAEGGFAYLMSNKPLRSIQDLKHRKIWMPVGDNTAQAVFETGGVSPVPLPMADVLTSLQTGLIDTITTSPIGAIALQWYTRIKYVTDAPLSYIYALLVIDAKAFKKISAKDQIIVREVMGRAYKKIDKYNRLENGKATEALKRQGVTFVPLSAQEMAQWKKIAATATEKLEKKGAYTAFMYKELNKHLQAYRRSRLTSSR